MRQPARRDIQCPCATSLENPHKSLIASSGKEFCVIVSHRRKLCGKSDYKDHHYILAYKNILSMENGRFYVGRSLCRLTYSHTCHRRPIVTKPHNGNAI